MTTKNKKSATIKYLEGLNGGPLTFAQLILAIRESEGKSQKDFAEKLGVSKQYLCDLEKGRRTATIEKAAVFADSLGYPAAGFVKMVIKDEIRMAGLHLEIQISA